VKSPCVGLCQVDDYICVGCFRSTREIARWSIMSKEERREALEQLDGRRKFYNNKNTDEKPSDNS